MNLLGRPYIFDEGAEVLAERLKTGSVDGVGKSLEELTFLMKKQQL